MKKTIIITSGIIAFVFFLLLLLPIFYKSAIELTAKKELNFSKNASINFNRTSLSFFSDFPNPTISLHNLTIVGKNDFNSDTLANIKEAAIEVSLWSLLFVEKMELKSLTLKNSNFKILILKDGKANFDFFMEKPDSLSNTDSSSVNLAFDKIEITNGTFIYQDNGLNTYIKMEGVNHIGSGDLLKDIFDFSTTTSIQKLTYNQDGVKYLTKKEVAFDFVMEINVKENKFSFKKNNIRINHFQLEVVGFFKLLANGYDMDLKFATTETEFKNILSIIPGIYMQDFKHITTKGAISFNGFIKGLYTDDSISKIPSFHVDVKVKDAYFKIDTLPSAIENIQLDFVVDNKYGLLDSTICDLRKFHLDMGKYPIDGRIKTIGITNPYIDAAVVAAIELKELQAMYPIKDVKLDGEIKFELKTKGVFSSLNNKLTKIPTFHLDLKLTNGKMKMDSLPTAIDDIQFHLLGDNGNGEIENTTFNLKTIHMNMGGNPIHGYAKISGYEKYFIDADLKASIKLEDLKKMYPISNFDLKGLFDLDIKAKGEYNQAQNKFPSINAKMNLTDGYILASDYPEPIENIHLISDVINKNGSLTDTKISINKLTYTLEGEPFDISGTITDLKNYIYDLKIKGKIDLAKITKIYPIENVKLAGIVNSDIETRGRIVDLENSRYDKISSDGTLEIKDLSLSGKAIPVPIKIKEALFSFTPTKIILKKMIGKIGKGNITLTGDLYNYMSFIVPNSDLIKGDMKLICDTLDFNLWFSENTVKTTNDSVQTNDTFFEVPKNIDFTFDSYINIVRYEDIELKRLNGEIKINDGVLTLNETGFNSVNARVKLSGDYNTKDSKHPFFDFALDVKDLEINKAYKEMKLIRSLAPALSQTYGTFTISYKIKGEFDTKMDIKTETLIGEGEVRIANAKINGMKIFEEISKTTKKELDNNPHIKDLVIKSKIKDNQLFIAPFEMKISGFDAEVEGVNTINGAINYIVKLQLFPIEKLKIPFHVTGTFDDPKVLLGKGHKLPE